MTIRVGSVTLADKMHRYLAEELGDGEWHDAEPLIRTLMRMVPPGIALREAERSRQASNKSTRTRRADPAQPVPEQRVRYVSTEQQKRFGARGWVVALLTPRAGGPYESRTVDGRREMRLVKAPRIVRGDALRADSLRPAFNGLAEHFTQSGMGAAAREVQLMAHEYGFHLASCPEGCRLVVVTRVGPTPFEELDADENREDHHA